MEDNLTSADPPLSYTTNGKVNGMVHLVECLLKLLSSHHRKCMCFFVDGKLIIQIPLKMDTDHGNPQDRSFYMNQSVFKVSGFILDHHTTRYGEVTVEPRTPDSWSTSFVGKFSCPNKFFTDH